MQAVQKRYRHMQEMDCRVHEIDDSAFPAAMCEGKLAFDQAISG